MAKSQSPPFAPQWLRCVCCVLTILPVVVVSIAVTIAPLTGAGLMALVLTGFLCKFGLYTLIHGQCPRSAWYVAARLLGAVVKLRDG